MLSKPMRRLACTTTTASSHHPAPAAIIPIHASSCRATQFPATSIFVSASTTAPSASCITARDQQQRGHQRRPSSSKASFPPNGNKSPPGEDGKRAADGNPQQQQTTTATEKSQRPSNANASASNSVGPARGGVSPSAARKSNNKSNGYSTSRNPSNDHHHHPYINLNLPFVPPTTHLNLGDVKVSSFFSLHRPISITPGIPPFSPNADHFNSIFTPRSASQKTNDVIYTLSSTASALDNAISQHHGGDEAGKELQWEMVQPGERNGQFDEESLEELMKQFRPFRVPPAPVPFDEAAAAAKSKAKQQRNKKEQLLRRAGEEDREALVVLASSAEQAEVAKQRSKTYTSTLTVSESTTSSGQRMWTAHASPFVEDRTSARRAGKAQHLATTAVQAATGPHQPFLRRMRDRQRSADKYIQAKITAANAAAAAAATTSSTSSSSSSSSLRVDANSSSIQSSVGAKATSGGAMLLISVKRQRKLKMKKHKYKKLMRRTRNLRRKLDRL